MKFLLNYLTKITFFCVYSRKAHEKKTTENRHRLAMAMENYR